MIPDWPEISVPVYVAHPNFRGFMVRTRKDGDAKTHVGETAESSTASLRERLS